MKITENLRIKKLNALIAPGLLIEQCPLDQKSAKHIAQIRDEASAIISGKDDRLLAIVGPCSIHDPKAALDYAAKLKRATEHYCDDLLIIMRVYFEKPRTTIGWKGLINDPELDGSFHINQGLTTARKLLLDINRLGVPTGSEFLDTIIPQYISDLTAWSAIGARTSESQIHRELASGLSMPVGFKNTTSGNIQVAADAVCAASHKHHFLGVSKQGVAAIVSTEGNNDCHIILRGSVNGPNYDSQSISEAIATLKGDHLTENLMVDCSHGNSQKDHRKQMHVAQCLAEQLSNGSKSIMGVMIESNLKAGKQSFQVGKPLEYGQSITDACVDWDETVKILDHLATAVKARRSVKE